MRTTTKLRAGSVHQLKITLRGTRPPVWRRLQVASSSTLVELHDIIQTAFGWEDCHLHQFVVGGVTYGENEGEGWGPRPKDEAGTKLSGLAPAGSQFAYEYDFGDSWEHDIVVENVLTGDPRRSYPTCLAGRRACPPEDCGGAWGFAELLEALADPEAAGDPELREWVGGEFDPDVFDLAAVNTRLGAQGLSRRVQSRPNNDIVVCDEERSSSAAEGVPSSDMRLL